MVSGGSSSGESGGSFFLHFGILLASVFLSVLLVRTLWSLPAWVSVMVRIFLFESERPLQALTVYGINGASYDVPVDRGLSLRCCLSAWGKAMGEKVQEYSG